MSHFLPHTLHITQSGFGKAPDGTDVTQFTLTNSNGIAIKIIDFGGIITEIQAPDKYGTFADIVLGFDHIEPYHTNRPYLGALIGRYANRIAQGKFVLNTETYRLAINNGINHLHGGLIGFDKVIWNSNAFTNENSVGLTLNYFSVDGEEGYPGNLAVSVTYELNNNNELLIKFHSTTDKATPVNLTQHSYFNLKGGSVAAVNDALSHQLEINAAHFIPVDATQIPLGKIQPVAGTAFDFRLPHAIGERINSNDQQLTYCGGYDHTFVLIKNSKEKELSLAARVIEPETGRVLEVFTEEPGLQFYSGNFLDGATVGKDPSYPYRSGFCLEPQHFPDSPNQPTFPNTILRPGEEYNSITVYKFSVVDEYY